MREYAITFVLLTLLSGTAVAQETPPTCDRENFKVAIDVGHSEQAPGATSARGVSEFYFNTELSKKIGEALTSSGFRNAILNETGGGVESLLRRARRASELQANLFISIHHDSVQKEYLKAWMFNGRTHYYYDGFSGFSLFVSKENPGYERSLAFAKELGAQLISHGRIFSRHHAEPIKGESREIVDNKNGIYRYDHLVVLRRTLMPAVLLEAGIVVNREDETRLADPAYQETTARAVASAVNAFCNSVSGELKNR
ncbi:cell wall hydrolase/autolysin [Rhodomicrobium vannielii ATCC 17100]|uniref:N-acetylmuramoyl-L-alanine amidase n=1 Tax=Rhodomicrobium vannielii (strain ATCC 17100 / DSM 162 / LMG 4299 / NCIMB 10020 / ATH 3.1.1) TaxID=648757 RepID=E3I557_RHOVT|nr:N-acetylmuramoyl-L-alanine amidase [Rhodomicrobium vannielii]ADP70507.1 cell wall hydrolase/autolysin [Rhodomicrobium vannielii ATCC 17100]